MSASADLDTATRYLRGELDDLDRTVFEERLLGDESLYQVVLAAEDELLDAHVAGALDGEVKARFDRRLAEEPTLRRRRALAAGLFARAAAAPARTASPKPAPTPVTPRRWTRWAVPALIAAAAAALVLLYLSREPASPPPEVVSIALNAPTRSSPVPEVVLVRGTRIVRVTLDTPTPPTGVEVRGPRDAVKARLVGPQVVELEAAAMVPGLHDLTASLPGDEVMVFQLRVVRR